MNKQETPLMRLIAKLKYIQLGSLNKKEAKSLNGVISLAESLLPYEREVIENFGNNLLDADVRMFKKDTNWASQFFNQTFKSE